MPVPEDRFPISRLYYHHFNFLYLCILCMCNDYCSIKLDAIVGAVSSLALASYNYALVFMSCHHVYHFTELLYCSIFEITNYLLTTKRAKARERYSGDEYLKRDGCSTRKRFQVPARPRELDKLHSAP